MTARALYLGGSGHKRVTHTNEALVVTTAAGQTLRYPLARVVRVVCSPAADWDGGALALCLKNGISITWADAKGNALGCALPNPPAVHTPTSLLCLMLEEPDGPAHYQNWQRSRRMAVLAQWGRTSPAAISPQQWETTKRQWVYDNQLNPHLPPALQAHCLAWVAAQLVAQHLPTQLCDALGNDVPLAADLGQLLWAEMNLCTGPLADQATTDQAHITLFEHWLTHNGASLSLHLGALLRLAKGYP